MMKFGVFFFFFKQKTAYEMRISDWSSDVCSSDLVGGRQGQREGGGDVHRDLLAQRLQNVSRGIALQRDQNADLAQARSGGVVDIGNDHALAHLDQIGRASCRESGCKYV